ncbi:hypothetical protein [Candidatus Phyllobacterium onerii]|uniref:hypothetical protein n=1 Tax=Candidatus Phyllobacterium onerii TaxID=3020828 RepID=UPI00232ABDE0|nr:hypothetical protein [Phyllobacterium sp. IY22]
MVNSEHPLNLFGFALKMVSGLLSNRGRLLSVLMLSLHYLIRTFEHTLQQQLPAPNRAPPAGGA